MAKYTPKKDYSSNLISKYNFDDNDNTCRDNMSGYNGIYNGTTKIIENDIAFRKFNGTGDYIKIPFNIVPIGKKSVRFKIKNVQNASGGYILNSEPVSGNPACGLYIICQKDGITFRITEGNNNQPLLINKNIDFSANDARDVLFTWDGTTSSEGVKLYIDNMLTPVKSIKAESTNETYQGNETRLGKYSPISGYERYFKGELGELEIYNEVIEFIDKRFLIQDKNNILYTLNGADLVQAPSQILDEDNFINNGFTDTDLITRDLLLSKFQSLDEIRLLVYTDDLDKNKCEMIYNCEPFRPIDKLKKNSDICNILFKEV
ncbi:LamG-like jellyroll fold domain-containing protein [Clostridium botulinum]